MAGNILYSFFEKIARLYGTSIPAVFIETGTGYGETTELAASLFRTVHSIELSEVLYKRAQEKFCKTGNVTCHFGDSKKILPQLIAEINEPVFFYLDAHYSGGLAAFGDEEVPLLEELTIIKHRIFPDIIAIDDFRLFGKAYVTDEVGDPNEQYPPISWDWCGITRKACRERLNETVIEDEFEYDDRLLFFMKNNQIRRLKLLIRKQSIIIASLHSTFTKVRSDILNFIMRSHLAKFVFSFLRLIKASLGFRNV